MCKMQTDLTNMKQSIVTHDCISWQQTAFSHITADKWCKSCHYLHKNTTTAQLLAVKQLIASSPTFISSIILLCFFFNFLQCLQAANTTTLEPVSLRTVHHFILSITFSKRCYHTAARITVCRAHNTAKLPVHTTYQLLTYRM